MEPDVSGWLAFVCFQEGVSGLRVERVWQGKKCPIHPLQETRASTPQLTPIQTTNWGLPGEKKTQANNWGGYLKKRTSDSAWPENKKKPLANSSAEPRPGGSEHRRASPHKSDTDSQKLVDVLPKGSAFLDSLQKFDTTPARAKLCHSVALT